MFNSHAVRKPRGEGLGGIGWREAQHGPEMYACSLESQPYPGLHQKKCGQQAEGGDSAPLLCSDETLPGVVHPALEPSALEWHVAIGAGAEEGHKSNPKNLKQFLRHKWCCLVLVLISVQNEIVVSCSKVSFSYRYTVFIKLTKSEHHLFGPTSRDR